MKVLILGYSVTAEKAGYVAYAEAENINPEIEFARVGYGGLQPHDARYLFPSIIARENPDVIILDQATPAFRKYTNDLFEYSKCVLSVVRECWSKKIRLAILDLPRSDVDYSCDWVTVYHRDIAGQIGIPRTLVAYDKSYVWDEVHPTEGGKKVYSKALLDLLEQATQPICSDELFSAVPFYDKLEVSEYADSNWERRVMNRGNDNATLVSLPADEEIMVELNKPYIVRGCSYLMGPRTGYLEFNLSGYKQRILAYDSFCYYERLGVASINSSSKCPGVKTQSIRIRQSAELPSVQLAKGQADTAKRVGAIGSILVERSAHCEG